MKMFTHNRDAEISLGPRFAWKCRPSLWSLKKSLSDRIDVYKWVLQSAVTYISLTFANFVWNPCCCSFLILSPCTRGRGRWCPLCFCSGLSPHAPPRFSPHRHLGKWKKWSPRAARSCFPFLLAYFSSELDVNDFFMAVVSYTLDWFIAGRLITKQQT